MNSLFSDGPLLPLQRPQYVPTPEAYLSALAWREFDVDLHGVSDKKQARRYGQLNAGASRAMEVRQTKPEAEDLVSFAAHLKDRGITFTGDSAIVANAVLESVAGVRIAKSGVQPASPLTPSIALAQNLRGLQGAANPPDLAGILESMFELGRHDDTVGGSASGLWRKAAERRLSTDPVLRKIDRAFDEFVLDSPRCARTPTASDNARVMSPLGADTPFAWFFDMWTKLTRDEWVDALPPRVWVDWATTVARMAFGMGFLWEAAWYNAVAREVLSEGSPDPLGRIEADPLIPWRAPTNSVTVRDVASTLKWRVVRGVQVRSVLSDVEHTSKRLDEQISSMRESKDVRAQLTSALQSTDASGSGKNAWEAVKYALRTREGSGDTADYYGFLATRARFLLPSPGTEWMAVVASLTAPEPGAKTDLAEFMHQLSRLGLRPELPTIIALLEESGLARGSADADQGVVVESAF